MMGKGKNNGILREHLQSFRYDVLYQLPANVYCVILGGGYKGKMYDRDVSKDQEKYKKT